MIPAGWRKVEWSAEVEASIGALLADPGEVEARAEAGTVEIFEVSGPGYGGILVTEMRRRMDGALLCFVLAYAGRGIRYGLADLAAMAAEAGAVALVHEAGSAPLWRLYESMGWRCTARFYEMGISNGQ